METDELIEKMVKLLERASFLAEDVEDQSRIMPPTMLARAEALRLDIEDLLRGDR